MIPTVQNVYDFGRSLIGDEGSQVYTNAVLQPHYQLAYADLFSAAQVAQSPRLRRECFYNLPANTSYLAPTTAGMTNVGEIEEVEERGSVTAKTVSGAAPGTATLALTVTGHGFTTGSHITVNGVLGISDDVNDIWTITVQDANTIILNGCTASGTYTGGTGTASSSGEEFVTVAPTDRINLVTTTPGDRLQSYAWEGDVFRFNPASSLRQLRIVYTLSGNGPTATTASVGFDDALQYLANQTMYRATRARDNDLWQEFKQDAGSALQMLLGNTIRAMQGLVFRRPPFRARRNRAGIW